MALDMTSVTKRMRRWFVSSLILGLSLVAPLAQAVETVTYYYTNPQGTPLATADASGTILSTSDYRPYGTQVLGSPATGPGYTGHVADPDSGLVYMQARYYDPVVGRFLAADPITPSGGDLYGFGRYIYVNNNPVNHVDPNGECLEDLCIVEGAVACAATPCGAIVAGAATAVIAMMTAHAIRNTPVINPPTTTEPLQDPPPTITQDSRSSPPPPLPEAGGNPHSIPNYKGGYTTYPNGDATGGKQYRPDGKAHGEVERPNVKEWSPNTAPDGKTYPGPKEVRYPKKDEVPKNSPEPKKYTEDN
jgi:RHS repeat-associated protein